MAKRFMKLRRVVIPVLVLVAMLAQATPAFALSANELTDLSQQVQQVEVVAYDSPTNLVLAQATAQRFEDFADIDSTTMQWAGEHLRWAFNNGVLKGKGNNKMDPGGTISAGEFIAMMARLTLSEDKLATYKTSYDAMVAANADDAINHWSAPETYAAQQAGLLIGLSGYSTKDSLDSVISRADMAVLVTNAMSLLGEKTESTAGISDRIPDWGKISGTSQASSILVAYQQGIIIGTDGNGTFNPDGSTTRASAAIVAHRIQDKTLRTVITAGTIKPISPYPVSTITEGKGSDTGLLPKEGDIYITADGTQVTLTKDNEVGVLGWNAIPGHKMDIYTGCLDKFGREIKHGSTVFAEDSTTGGGLIEGPQGWWTAREWQHIMNVSEPTYSGKADGETAVDGIWTWDSGEWCWTGPFC